LPIAARKEIAMGDIERRDATRQKTFLRGIIYYNNRSAAADCLVRDISDTGARLELSENVVIPYEIDLHIPKKGETYRACVQWRHGDGVGISFANPVVRRTPDRAADAVETSERGQDGAELTDRVQRLEAEVSSLKRAIKELLDSKTPSLRLPV
jgi:PilZ domain-containing protein